MIAPSQDGEESPNTLRAAMYGVARAVNDGQGIAKETKGHVPNVSS